MKTTTDAFKTKFHRDGTVTFWNVFEQRWNRTHACFVHVRDLAAMKEGDRNRTIRIARVQVP